MTASPNYLVPTGEYIEEWMDDAGVNAAELARRLGVSAKHVSELLNGKASLSAELSLKLEHVTGVPARIWSQYEAVYQGDKARLAEDADLEDQYEDAKSFPLSFLRKWGYINSGAQAKAGTVRELLNILGIGTLSAFQPAWAKGSVAYRRSAIAKDDGRSLAVWLRLAEYRQSGISGIEEFDGSSGSRV